MVYTMNIIMTRADILPYLLPTLALGIIIITITMVIMMFFLREGVGRILVNTWCRK